MNNEIRKSVKNIMNISEDMSDVNAFAREKFKEKFKGKSDVWFKSYRIVDEGTIEVTYGRGIYEESFNVDLWKN